MVITIIEKSHRTSGRGHRSNLDRHGDPEEILVSSDTTFGIVETEKNWVVTRGAHPNGQ